MTIQTIGIGSGANNGTGDPLRTAMDKINQNFSQLVSPRASSSTSSAATSYYDETGTDYLAVQKRGSAAFGIFGSNGAAEVYSYGAPLNIGTYTLDPLFLGVNAAAILTINTSGNFTPTGDNLRTNGSASLRWSVVYAGTGTINTSDAREKTVVASMTAAEIAAAKDLAREIGTYQFLASVAEKGADNARRHAGMTVQRAIEVMQSHGLDPFRYGFICHDSWEDEFIDHPAIVADEENGIEAKAAWREQVQTAGDRYAFRPDELLFFIARGLEARLTALEGA